MYRKKKNLLISTPQDSGNVYTLFMDQIKPANGNVAELVNKSAAHISPSSMANGSRESLLGGGFAGGDCGLIYQEGMLRPGERMTQGGSDAIGSESCKWQVQSSESQSESINSPHSPFSLTSTQSNQALCLNGLRGADRRGFSADWLDIRPEDLRLQELLGRGSSGVVHKAVHVNSGCVMAVKRIPIDVVGSLRKDIMLELQTLQESQSRHIVKYYGAFFSEGAIFICLEYMDGGPMSELVAKAGPIPEPILSGVAKQVLLGLVYLHKERHLIHRDVKPSNLLVSKTGEVKVADFGVSGQLGSTISTCCSWVGTVTYMSPERILGKSYGIYSDIWSFGLTMMEMAVGYFPYPIGSSEQSGGFWELLDHIVDQPAPKLPNTFSEGLRDFVGVCLQKDYTKRPLASTLLEHPWIKQYECQSTNIYEWSQSTNDCRVPSK